MFKALSITEPDAQMHIVVVGKNAFGNRRHSGQCGIPEHDRVEPGTDRYTDLSGRFRPGGTGAIVAPIGKLSIGVDESEFE